MKFEITEEDLALLYIRAKKYFDACIQNEDNMFLQDELNIPLESIKILSRNVKVVFSNMDFGIYPFEVCLTLFDERNETGKYLYI